MKNIDSQEFKTYHNFVNSTTYWKIIEGILTRMEGNPIVKNVVFIILLRKISEEYSLGMMWIVSGE